MDSCRDNTGSSSLWINKTYLLQTPLPSQTSSKQLAEQRELLLQRLTESNATNQHLQSQLEEKESLAMHSQVREGERNGGTEGGGGGREISSRQVTSSMYVR